MSTLLALLTTLSLAAALPRPPFDLPSSSLVLRKHVEISAQSCDLSKAIQPLAPSPLPPPSTGLFLSQVAIGRGTQNYTCADSSPTTIPAADGALATLFDASCIAASYPTILEDVPGTAVKRSIAELSTLYSPSGHHYFIDRTTPTFDMATIGLAMVKKTASSLAPKNKSGDVAWLKLERPTTTSAGAVGEVYRLNTSGGSPPPTCSGMPSHFEVQYAAEYWFYSSS